MPHPPPTTTLEAPGPGAGHPHPADLTAARRRLATPDRLRAFELDITLLGPNCLGFVNAAGSVAPFGLGIVIGLF